MNKEQNTSQTTEGDPGRTLVKENAKTFKRKSDAEKLCNEMKIKYPNRNVWVDVF